ncbi:hypothetical protein DL766_009961 [Monosporascus sp. MC13-8B]|uniref:Cytochrome c oxidase copper chaperone n=1 Tax=Monosporascus cannonballus TaxID=155416 RepID=A0ABY0HJH1_9PEZI|nr:hypothetical protein DL762_001911 [Monosporascus cannonballus]RYO99068.1 hypothetical protein DL763_001770 [Monosporascus cannonballus]RYP12417.1 hypothetical protein DL766_009961 [Monosporascus sp. MC13-8B]
MASQAASITSLTSKAEAKPAVNADAASKPKPCCACKEEKSKRDECMLFSKSTNPASECQTTIDQYRSCMAGFGFQV